MMPTLVNEFGAASYLGMSVHTLRRWRLFRTGPVFLKVGGKSVRYRVADLQTFLAKGQISAGKQGA